MKLYHGTNETVARVALTEGLKPRSMTKASNWKHTVLSHKDMIYLTDTYPLYFALNSIQGTERAAVIEIDTDKLLPWEFMPDEDYLEQATRKTPDDPKTDWDMKKRNRWYRARLQQFSGYWEESLKRLGTCAYHGIIGPQAITRVAFIDYKKQSVLAMRGMDPSISIVNFGLCSKDYQHLIPWLFDGTYEPTERDGMLMKLGFPSTKEVLEKEGRAGISIEIPNLKKEDA
jgi:hypothetical protein